MDHQQKLEKELSDITDKFNAKKRKFTESSEEFAEKLKEVGHVLVLCSWDSL